MKRFLITSTKFEGQCELVYNDKGTLVCIDMRGAQMDEQTCLHFKHACPITLPALMSGKHFTKETVIVEADFEITFEKFYADYPYKRNRYKVEEAWEKLSKSNQVKAFFSLHEYKKFLMRTGCYAMIGDRYLRQREFETDWKKANHKS
ncbi:MAG: hypothetical protein ACTHK8_18925 [Ginsengibacter sp.]